jgi:hypothetical protein
VQPRSLFWPSNRKLFRERPRMRGLAPVAGVVAAACLVLVAGQFLLG